MIQPRKIMNGKPWGTYSWMSSVLLVGLVLGGCAGTPQPPKNEPLLPSEQASPPVAQLLLDGNRLFAEHRWTAAIGKYEEAIQAQPKLAEAHYNLGLALSKRRLFSEARPHFERAVELEPFNQVIRNAPPFRKYEPPAPGIPEPAHDGHSDHQH